MTQRILLCDDEVHIQRAAQVKLARAGYEVHCANDGEEAWQNILQQPPDLLITDCQMPRLGGLELCQRVRQHAPTRQLPIFILTAKGFELEFNQAAQRWGVLELIAKPFSPRELLRSVERVLGPPQTSAPGGQPADLSRC